MAKAFPTAYGFGENTTGGRGGSTVFITNTNDSGAGSARAAFTASGARHVVPKVGGLVTLETDLEVTNANFTYHGHLAPGGGLMFKKRNVEIGADNVICRHLKTFPGHEDAGQTNGLWVKGINGCVMDHCTSGWSDDQCMDAYGSYQNVTFQWNLIAEPSDRIGQNFGSLIGRPTSYAFPQTISLHHNVWVLCKNRMPECLHYIGGGYTYTPQVRIDFRNNLSYRWNGNNRAFFGRIFYTQAAYNAFIAAAGLTAAAIEVNLIGNHFIKGPTSTAENDAFTLSKNCKAYARNNIGPESASPLDGFNVKVTRHNANWAGDGANISLHGTYDPSELIQATEYVFPTIPTHDATEVFDLLTANAGATLPVKDALWTRLMGHVINGDGTFGAKLDYPTLATGTYPTHSQPDGIPDSWKTANGLSTGTDYTGVQAPSGYDWLEVYSHEVAGDGLVEQTAFRGSKRRSRIFVPSRGFAV